jgi:crotonobetainyl-CoA:carnitine CoA-transferase CaiB-like acyl-CoA transferase
LVERLPALSGLARSKVYSKVWPIAHSCGLNWGSIRAPDELVDEGHLNDRGFWVEVPHPELDRSFKYPGPAGIYNGSPWRISRRAPLIGEHNEEIYCGELGLQRTELAYLAESGVV